MNNSCRWLWQSFSTAELDFTDNAAKELEKVDWARPLLDHCRQRGHLPYQIREKGPNPNRRPHEWDFLSDFFEIRFAFALATQSIQAKYEHAAEVGNSTIDFRLETDPPWLVELVSLRVTEAVGEATHVHEDTGQATFSLLQSSDAENEYQTPAYEMYAAQCKIGEKVIENGRPTKFPISSDSLHMILVDMRGYNAGDSVYEYDFLQIAVGAQPDMPDMAVMCKRKQDGEPLRGLFENQCPLRAAGLMRERIHFLGFTSEKCFNIDELASGIYMVNNPHLLATLSDIRAARKTWPFNGSYRPVVASR